jgi:hypothetical protein
MERNAPPAANRLEAIPINAPAMKIPAVPGNSRVCFGRTSKNMVIAAYETSTVKIMPSARFGSTPAASAAPNDPARIPGDIARVTA